MKYLISILSFVMIGASSFSQENNQRSYKKAKVYLEDHRILKVNDLRLSATEALFSTTEDKSKNTLPLEAIRFIRTPKGSYWLEGALYGAGTMALTAVLIDAQPDALGRDQKKSSGFYLGLTGGGAVVGALVGSIFPKWKELYSGGKLVGVNLPLRLDYDAFHDQFVIKITVSL
ncbi:hypothetical protein [Spongiimicrobium salis]|uniref:hypothetical protein n=1 Tax=Spongiimicrobium salis TaxID=1667022 RepID=UPI00374D4342